VAASRRALVALGLDWCWRLLSSRCSGGAQRAVDGEPPSRQSRPEPASSGLQVYFGDMAVSQRAVASSDWVPALARSGPKPRGDQQPVPEAHDFDDQWAHILNDMTPMIGAMSRQRRHYKLSPSIRPRAISRVLRTPGLIVIGSATAAGGPGRARRVLDARLSDIPGPLVEESNEAKTRSVPAPDHYLSTLVVSATLAVPATATATGALSAHSRSTACSAWRRVHNFRMVYPAALSTSRTLLGGPQQDLYVDRCRQRRGLRTGALQPAPAPAFDHHGNSLGAHHPTTDFAGIKLRPRHQGTAPAISVSGYRLTGQVKGFTAEWNNLSFSQGGQVTGSYNAQTHVYVLTWSSLISGGPFNGFTGSWHLTGTSVSSGRRHGPAWSAQRDSRLRWRLRLWLNRLGWGPTTDVWGL